MSTTLTAGDIWRAVTRRSFAVLSHVTLTGSPRSSGVLYAVHDGRLYVAVATGSWKARHIAAGGAVAVTVPIRRGGPLALLMPIPPATVSFAAEAVTHPGAFLDDVPQLARLMPAGRRSGCTVLEIRPVGHFITYGVGVPLLRMRDPGRSRARVAIGAAQP